MDTIDDDLERLVTYLNKITAADIRVTALQLSYARHGDIEVLVPSTYGGELADAKAREAGEKAHWTKESFLTSLAQEADQRLAANLLKRVEATERRGPRPQLWFGESPGGGIYLHPYGHAIAPAWISIDKRGKLKITGAWKMYSSFAHHDGFTPLAALMGRSHKEGAIGVEVCGLDQEALWTALETSARAINEPGASTDS